MIFLINNGGYTIERGYLGKTESYNDIANWSYADLPKVFRRDTQARSFVVKTVTDLQNALSAPNDTMIFVESIMDRYDALAPVLNSSNKGADLDYGPNAATTSSGQPHRTADPSRGDDHFRFLRAMSSAVAQAFRVLRANSRDGSFFDWDEPRSGSCHVGYAPKADAKSEPTSMGLCRLMVPPCA